VTTGDRRGLIHRTGGRTSLCAAAMAARSRDDRTAETPVRPPAPRGPHRCWPDGRRGSRRTTPALLSCARDPKAGSPSRP